MRQAFKACALLLAALSVCSGAACREGGAGSQSKNTEAAPGASAEKPSDPFARIPRMSVEELKRALDEGRAVVADVRPAEAFEEEHIAGALSVPEDDWAAHAGDLPQDKLVVTYCA
jgi:hypothetical protein